MKKKLVLAAAALAAVSMTACGSQSENVAAKDYKASDYVTLGTYTGLEVQQVREKTGLTDEETQSAIDDALEQDATEREITDRVSEEGDYLDISYTCTQNGEVVDETGDSDAAMQLGQYEYFDEDGEKQLLGTKAGDTRTIVVDGGEEEDPQSYTYEVTVKRVYTYDIPELTDDYAREQGYDSAGDMKKAVAADALESTNEDYVSSAKDELLQDVVSNSTNDDYPQKLYDETLKQLDQSYQDFFGITVEDAFDGDEDSLRSMVEDTLLQELVVEAIAEKEHIVVTQDELDTYKQQAVDQYGYDDISSLEAEYSDDTMAESLLNEKVRDFLYEKAKVTYVSEDEYYAAEDADTADQDDSTVSDTEELSEDIVDEMTDEQE
ncbi:MAG: hypothetical protein V8S26_09200 [Lachnospiraceae bacterium]